MMAEFTKALFFLAVISLSVSQSTTIAPFEGELELKVDMLARSDESECDDCELMLDRKIGTSIMLIPGDDFEVTTYLSLKTLHCFEKFRIHYTNDPDDFKEFHCTNSGCECVVVNEYIPCDDTITVEVSDLLDSNADEYQECKGMLGTNAEYKVRDVIEYYMHELFVAGHVSEIAEDQENGGEGQYSLAVCHSINVVLSVTSLLIAFFLQM